MNLEAEIAAIKVEIENLKRVFGTIESLAVNVEKLATETKYVREDINKLSCRLDTVEAKPLKTYEKIKDTLIVGIIGIVLGAIAVLIGLKAS